MISSQQRPRRRVVPGTARGVAGPNTSSTAIIPYDYAARFTFIGRRGNVVQDVVNISAEGAFVAVAIGYGFEEERGRPLRVPISSLGASPPAVFVPGDLTLGEIPPQALIEGLRVHPRFEPLVFRTEQVNGQGLRGTGRNERELSDQVVSVDLLSPPDQRPGLFERVKLPEEISFLFNIIDSGSGRELQDEPIHNLASLGKSNGERPFRLLAQPLSFLPRSTIRLQVIEQSEGVRGTLFIVLYGYKMLGGIGCPEPVVRSLRGTPACPTETIGRPGARVIPFDYVATLQLAGRPGNLVEGEVSINVEGGFVGTAIGYGLLVEERDVPIQWERASDIVDANRKAALAPLATAVISWQEALRRAPATAGPPPSVNLAQLSLRLLSPGALSDGIRIRPNFLRIAFADNGNLATAVPADLVDKIFERLNRPEDVSFRYMIFDGGRGLELQNQLIHNIAGLGIANGDRPFKKFARPMIFLPRSTIRVMVEERFGRGTLFLAFHGYKVLGTAPMGGQR
jgi:hypothetical protein